MNICIGCGEETKTGQALNGLLKCHWDCTDVVRSVMGQQEADDMIQQRVDKRLRMEGLDPTHRLWKTLGGSL